MVNLTASACVPPISVQPDGTCNTPGQIGVTTLNGLLAGCDVTVSTSDACPVGPGHNGDITVTALTNRADTHLLTLQADRNITINAGTAITNTMSGGLQLTASGGAITNNSLINMSGGPITLQAKGNVTFNFGVGNGLNNSAPAALMITAGDSTTISDIFLDSPISLAGGTMTLTADRDITVTANSQLFNNAAGGVSLTSGNNPSNFGDIILSSTIQTVTSGSNIDLTAGRNISVNASGGILNPSTGNITLTAGNNSPNNGDITLNATVATTTGDITLQTTFGNITVAAVAGGSDVGVSSDQQAVNGISITTSLAGTPPPGTGNLHVTGFNNLFAKIGADNANSHCDISIDITGDIILTSGNGVRGFAQIGHGGAINFPGPVVLNGNILINPSGSSNGLIHLDSTGGGADAFTQIGHRPSTIQNAATKTDITGSIEMISGSVTLEGGPSLGSYALIGHGGGSSTASPQGQITYHSVFPTVQLIDIVGATAQAGDIKLTGGTANDSYAAMGLFSSQNTTIQYDLSPTAQPYVARVLLFTSDSPPLSGGNLTMNGGSAATRGGAYIGFYFYLPDVAAVPVNNVQIIPQGGATADEPFAVLVFGFNSSDASAFHINGGSGIDDAAVVGIDALPGTIFNSNNPLHNGLGAVVDVSGQPLAFLLGLNQVFLLAKQSSAFIQDGLGNPQVGERVTVVSADTLVSLTSSNTAAAEINGTGGFNGIGGTAVLSQFGDVDLNGTAGFPALITSYENTDVVTGFLGFIFGGSINLNSHAQITNNGPFDTGSITISACQNIQILGTSFVDALNSNSNITLIVDQNSPFPPLIGPGFINLDASSHIGHLGYTGELRIFTARQAQNTINGLLNGVAFSPGVHLVTDVHNQYGVYAFLGNGTFIDPNVGQYRVYYKEGFVFPPTPEEIAASLFHGLGNDFFTYDEEVFWDKDFDIRYLAPFMKANHVRLLASEKTLNELYFLRRRKNLLNQNPYR